MLTVRPKVAELAFHLYSRPLHPELFEVHRSQTLSRSGYHLQIDITSAGHVITWRSEQLTLAEVAASATHPLPQKRRLITGSLRGEQSDQADCRGGVVYRCTYQLETVSPTTFWAFQKRLCEEPEHGGLLHRFDSSGRIAIGAASFIHAVSRDRQVTLRACHTFPDDCAIVRTTSEIILP